MDDQLVSFELNFTVRHRKELISFDQIPGTDLVSVLAQFQLILALTMKRLMEIQVAERHIDEDIPF